MFYQDWRLTATQCDTLLVQIRRRPVMTQNYCWWPSRGVWGHWHVLAEDGQWGLLDIVLGKLHGGRRPKCLESFAKYDFLQLRTVLQRNEWSVLAGHGYRSHLWAFQWIRRCRWLAPLFPMTLQRCGCTRYCVAFENLVALPTLRAPPSAWTAKHHHKRPHKAASALPIPPASCADFCGPKGSKHNVQAKHQAPKQSNEAPSASRELLVTQSLQCQGHGKKEVGHTELHKSTAAHSWSSPLQHWSRRFCWALEPQFT